MAFTCPKCQIDLDTEGGLKRHMTKKHGGYYADDLRNAGITPNERDIARALDGGNTSIDTVIDSAPNTESSTKTNSTGKRGGTAKESRILAEQQAEFQRLRPQLVERWKRRLRIPYSLWARLASDPGIALTEKELEEGATMHVDFCEAMGWLKAGKIEAIMDLTLWHGATALSRSELGKQLLNSFNAKEQPPEA